MRFLFRDDWLFDLLSHLSCSLHISLRDNLLLLLDWLWLFNGFLLVRDLGLLNLLDDSNSLESSETVLLSLCLEWAKFGLFLLLSLGVS